MATTLEDGDSVNLHVGRGSEPDYRFGVAEGWDAFEVVRWHSTEALSQPFLYELTLLRRSARGLVDPEGLVDAPASFAITHEKGHRLVHGVIGSAEEIDRTSTFSLIRVELVPPIVRAKHRGTCRSFRKRGVRDVIERLLENRPPGMSTLGVGALSRIEQGVSAPQTFSADAFAQPTTSYRWALFDPESPRLSDIEYRSTVIQYNESDFDLLTRLLEEEGLTYYFEHGIAGSVMTITDRPASAPAYGEQFTHELRAGAHALDSRHERLRTFRHRHDLRPTAARVMDHDRFAPKMRLDGQAVGLLQAATGEHALFSAPGGPGTVALFSRVNMERHDAHRSLCSGSGNIRTLEPGRRFNLHDGDGLREDRDLVIVSVEAFGQQLTPDGTVLDQEGFGFRDELSRVPFFESRFHGLRADRNFRPAVTRTKPRMAGVHRAVVTVEEGGAANPEINANANGDIRVRFSWDDRPPEPGIASSKWIPVANYTAGTGWGSHHTPRVGQTVFVAFHDGDPDQPVVMGGFYSSQTPSPYDASQLPTVSAYRSQSSPGGGGFNEMRFDDAAGAEQFSTRAQLDAAHAVGRHSTRGVGGNDSTSIVGDHSHDVGGDSAQSVDGDNSHDVGGDHSQVIGGDSGRSVGGNDTHSVGGDQSVGIGGALSTSVGGSETRSIGGDVNINVKGDYHLNVEGVVKIKAKMVILVGSEGVAGFAPEIKFDTGEGGDGGADIHMEGVDISIDGPASAKVHGGILTASGGFGGGGSEIVMTGVVIKESAPLIALNPG